jgi:Leucine-rich repeat (LRR) protein
MSLYSTTHAIGTLTCQDDEFEIKDVVLSETASIIFLCSCPMAKKLKFTNASMHHIPSNILPEMVNLEEIEALNCGIQAIEVTSFGKTNEQNLQKLERLDLEHNQISRLESDQFAGAKNLQKLFLSYNQISEIDEAAFDGLESLEILALENNRLKELPPTVFSDLVAMDHVYLSDNKLDSIDMNVFENNTKLHLVSLNNNNIAMLYFDEFPLLPNLKFLSMSGNKITDLDYENVRRTLPKLKYIGISGNEWNCTYLMHLIPKLYDLGLRLWLNSALNEKENDQVSINRV